MSHSTDTLLNRYVGEIDERQKFMDGLVEQAQKEGRDLNEQEMELVTRASARIEEVNGLMKPLEEARRISSESHERLRDLARYMGENGDTPVREAKYRSAGEYVLDRWRGGLGNQEAVQRLDLYHRAAAHQTTPDNPGLLPERILEPVIEFVDVARPLVSLLGPRQLPAGSWSRPRITQHTKVDEQTAEKTELASQKMVIGTIPVAAKTYGGYVNVSRQNIDWSQPQVMDIVISDLAAQYALLTENVACDAFAAAATAEAALPASPTADDVAEALWVAAGNVYNATRGQGRLVGAASPDMLGLIGPLFAPIAPGDAQSPGFWASAFGQGPQGSVAGISFTVSAGLNAGTLLVMSTAAAEVYEDRIGSLQVVEPSVLGIQVAYAGYFAPLVIEATGIRKIPKT